VNFSKFLKLLKIRKNVLLFGAMFISTVALKNYKMRGTGLHMTSSIARSKSKLDNNNYSVE